MKTLFERDLADGRRAADVLLAPAKQNGTTLNFVDIGARNGSYILPHRYAERCRLVGFEPNPEEYEKLVAGRTDAAQAGLREPDFLDRRYYPVALWRESGERELTITRGAGAATLMGEAHVGMSRNLWWDKFDRGRAYYDEVQAPVGTAQVRCDALDNIWAAEDGLIDILKIDVEGGECAVLQGASKLLSQRRVLMIRSEFLLTPYYRDHILLGHQQVYLDGLGYRLVAFDNDHATYCWKRTSIPQDMDRRFMYAGDAYFMIDPDLANLDAERKYRLGLACVAFGFSASGLNLVRESDWISDADIALLEAAASQKSVGRKLREVWDSVPHVVYRYLSALR